MSASLSPKEPGSVYAPCSRQRRLLKVPRRLLGAGGECLHGNHDELGGVFKSVVVVINPTKGNPDR